MIIKCYFQSCKATVEVADIDHQAPPAFAWRNQNSLSGKPWCCAYHETMLEATLRLSPHEVGQLRELVSQVRLGKMTKADRGFYEQVAPAPVKPFTIREDDGSIRTTSVKWWSQEQMLAALNPETSAPADDYTVNVKAPENDAD